MEVERGLAVKDWHRQLSRCGLLAVALVCAEHFLARPSVPASSRRGWEVFFALLALATAIRTIGAWRRLRGVSQ